MAQITFTVYFRQVFVKNGSPIRPVWLIHTKESYLREPTKALGLGEQTKACQLLQKVQSAK